MHGWNISRTCVITCLGFHWIQLKHLFHLYVMLMAQLITMARVCFRVNICQKFCRRAMHSWDECEANANTSASTSMHGTQIIFQQTITLISCHVTLLVQSGKLLFNPYPQSTFSAYQPPKLNFTKRLLPCESRYLLNFSRIFCNQTKEREREREKNVTNSLDTNDIFLYS